MKTCPKCKTEKENESFGSRGPSKGLQSWCKACTKQWQNSPEGKGASRQYYLDNKAEHQKRHKEWAQTHPEEMRTLQREWARRSRRDNPHFRVKQALRARIKSVLRGRTKTGSSVHDLGCSVPELISHLESQFGPGMSWDNWGRGKGNWNIDHIIPLAAFNLLDRQHFLLASHYLNLQPLWFEDNLSKGDKLEYVRLR